MPYLLTGTMHSLFTLVDKSSFISQMDALSGEGAFHKDVNRTNFLGTAEQAQHYYKAWRQHFKPEYYAQGCMSAGILRCLFRDQPLMSDTEENDPEAHAKNYVYTDMAFLDTRKRPCGLTVLYRRDNPGQWIIGFMRNGHLAPDQREVWVLSSTDLADENMHLATIVTKVPLLENLLMKELGSSVPADLLKMLFNRNTGHINIRFDHIHFILRSLRVAPDNDAVMLNDPVDFGALDLEQLFEAHPVLDYVNQTLLEIPLTFKLLQELLTPGNQLSKRITETSFIDGNRRANQSIRQMIFAFYEIKKLDSEGVRTLLNDHGFIARFSGMMSNRTMIFLLPFMREQKYDEELISKILAQPSYYNALSMILDLGEKYAVNFPELFNNTHKLSALNFINSLDDPDCKKLCYLFWVIGNLTLDGYKRIVAATQQYPLMAYSLVEMYKEGLIINGGDGLEEFALNASLYLKTIIKRHFFANQNKISGLNELDSEALHAAQEALKVLKDCSIEERDYRFVVSNDHNGKILRLLLPQLASIAVPTEKKQLVAVLFTGIKEDINAQEAMVNAIQDSVLYTSARALYEQYRAVSNLLEMDCGNLAVFAAQNNNPNARCFRDVKTHIDEQCRLISRHLATEAAHGEAEQNRQRIWEGHVTSFRRELYKIVHEALTTKSKTPNVNNKIKETQANILKMIDPPASFIKELLVLLANLLIFCLVPFVAHGAHYAKTGNVLFFNGSFPAVHLSDLGREMDRAMTPYI